MNRHSLIQCVLWTIASLTAIHWRDVACADSPPNIVFILADDMGVGDVSCLNPNSKIHTPAIDQIAKEGMTFTDAHTASSVCTPNEQFAGKSQAGTYGDFVTEVDWSVGQIVAALKDQGLYDNTLFIFTADNGYSPKAFPDFQKEQSGHHPSHIYAGFKGRLYEGGHRVAFIASWPAVVKAGSQSDVMVCLNDLMATCAELTDVDLPANAGEDSFSFLSALRGDETQIRETLVSHSFPGDFAIRKGKWKLLLPSNERKRELFDLSSDVGEQNRLDKSHSQQVADLKATLAEIINKGRETPGPKQAYVHPTQWPQIDWINE